MFGELINCQRTKR